MGRVERIHGTRGFGSRGGFSWWEQNKPEYPKLFAQSGEGDREFLKMGVCRDGRNVFHVALRCRYETAFSKRKAPDVIFTHRVDRAARESLSNLEWGGFLESTCEGGEKAKSLFSQGGATKGEKLGNSLLDGPKTFSFRCNCWIARNEYFDRKL
jgi:hypothetical protein